MTRRNRKKKISLLVAASLSLALLLTGCGSAGQEAETSSAAQAQGHTTEESATPPVTETEATAEDTAQTQEPIHTQTVSDAMLAGPATIEGEAGEMGVSRTTGATSTEKTADANTTAASGATTRRTTTTKESAKQTTRQTSTTRRTTTAAPSPTTSRPVSNSLAAYREEVLRLVNEERQKAGVSPLTADSGLNQVAQLRAEETIVKFDHVRPDGSKFYTALQQAGISYRTTGENIAYGQRSPAEVMTGWMNSSGHRQNILNAAYGKLGVGYVLDANGRAYWVQIFTN